MRGDDEIETFRNLGRHRGAVFRILHCGKDGGRIALYDGYWDYKTNIFKLYPIEIYDAYSVKKAGTKIAAEIMIEVY